ncbi:MAG: glycosyltransferase family 4 protein [Psychromonas sp.]
MNIVLLCTKYSLCSASKWLTNELAEALVLQGNKVDVIFLDWSSSTGEFNNTSLDMNGVEVHVVKSWGIGRGGRFASAIKWAFSSISVVKKYNQLVRDRKFDLVISFSPSLAMFFSIVNLCFFKNVKKILIQWDFFPYHQRQIGLMPSTIIYNVAKVLEGYLIRRFDYIFCMSERNISYLKSHYNISSKQVVEQLPIWGGGEYVCRQERKFIRQKYKLPPDCALVVFGGQLVEGRGVEDVVTAAKMAQKNAKGVAFLIIGEGRLTHLITSAVSRGISNIHYIPQVTRAEYFDLICACDIALVCTVQNVDVPTFPSKTIDYLRAGLPIIASVEKSTDYGEYIKSKGLGVSVDAGNPQSMLSAIIEMIEDNDRIKKIKIIAPLEFKENFDVNVVVRKMLAIVCGE